MADDPGSPASALTARDRRKDEVRDRILDELIALMIEDVAITHDVIAERAGIGRRTVYRYFPDRESLMQAAWARVQARAGPQVGLPASMEELLATLAPIYTGFDSIAPIATVVRSTPQGRALRLSSKARRVAAYRKAAAEAVKDLPEGDRLLATAMFQVLHTTPWLEMRDHWDLDGEQIARATHWAIRALLADLAARRGRPLDEDLAGS
jgi:AcrR family transcriptional regulator